MRAAGYMSIATFFAATWNISSYYVLLGNDVQTSLVINRVIYFSALSISLSFFYFSADFNGSVSWLKRYYRFAVLISFLVIGYCVLSTDLVIKEVSAFNPGLWPSEFGTMYLVYLVFILILWVLSFVFLILKYRHTSKQESVVRRQLSTLSIGGALLFFAAYISELLLPYLGVMETYWLGPLIPVLFSALIAYSILKHHLFNIEVPINEALSFVLVVGSLVQVVITKDPVAQKVAWVVFIVTIIIAALLIRSTFALIKRGRMIEEMHEAKKDFLQIASHQLKTPVSVILGTVDVLKDIEISSMTKDEIHSLITGLETKAHKLSSVVSDMLDAVHFDSVDDSLLIYNEKTNVKSTIENVIQTLRPEAEENGSSISLSISSENESYYTSSLPTALNRVLSIVVDNAIRYTRDGTINVELNRKNGMIVLHVQDTGIGIPESELSGIFDRFTRGSNAIKTHTDGSGIGLFVAKKIIERHEGGNISIDSELGKGTSVVLEFKPWSE